MTKTLMALAAGTALATGAPALSQTNYYANANTNMTMHVQQLQTQLQTGVQSGQITRNEARPIRQRLQELRQLERQYAANGLTRTERQDLQIRIRDLRSQINYASRNDLTRYGANNWIDNNRDGFDDRDINRDGILDRAYAANSNYQNGYYGQGGPYEPAVQCQPRSGIAGVLSSVLGTSNCGLQVGQQVGSGLYAVPYQYQGQYRDGNGVYYRSDGRNIYQIDARTNTVVRVFNQ
ncbi:MAG: hypothetical protein ACJ8EY_08395 [Sphingomicrobium sp.]